MDIDFTRTGRIISPSKSAYVVRYPDHTVVFNAYLVTRSKGVIWYGDLDLTLDQQAIQHFTDQLGEDVIVFRESHIREGQPIPFDKAVQTFTPQGGAEQPIESPGHMRGFAIERKLVEMQLGRLSMIKDHDGLHYLGKYAVLGDDGNGSYTIYAMHVNETERERIRQRLLEAFQNVPNVVVHETGMGEIIAG